MVGKLNNYMILDTMNTYITTYDYDLLFCSVGRKGHAIVHAMTEMHGRYVVDMRSREGLYVESFLCLSIW